MSDMHSDHAGKNPHAYHFAGLVPVSTASGTQDSRSQSPLASASTIWSGSGGESKQRPRVKARRLSNMGGAGWLLHTVAIVCSINSRRDHEAADLGNLSQLARHGCCRRCPGRLLRMISARNSFSTEASQADSTAVRKHMQKSATSSSDRLQGDGSVGYYFRTQCTEIPSEAALTDPSQPMIVGAWSDCGQCTRARAGTCLCRHRNATTKQCNDEGSM